MNIFWPNSQWWCGMLQIQNYKIPNRITWSDRKRKDKRGKMRAGWGAGDVMILTWLYARLRSQHCSHPHMAAPLGLISIAQLCSGQQNSISTPANSTARLSAESGTDFVPCSVLTQSPTLYMWLSSSRDVCITVNSFPRSLAQHGRAYCSVMY